VTPPTTPRRSRRRPSSFRTWAEWLDPDAAEPQYAYDVDGPADGRPAVVTNTVGDGQVTYCGVWPESDLADALASDLLDRAGVRYAERLPDGVRIGYRGGRTWVTNFTSDRLRLPEIDPESRWRLTTLIGTVSTRWRTTTRTRLQTVLLWGRTGSPSSRVTAWTG